jgi:pimeloyl-ACP methyl ester carboxylesterase
VFKVWFTNVVIVDWGHGSGWPYTQAAANTRVVGAEVAKLIEFLVAEGRANIANFHLIGHSLGAHDVLSIIFLCRNILLPIVTC